MAYDAVVIPGNMTIRSTTLARLKKFKDAGGKVIWAGDMPSCVDGEENSDALAFAKDCVRIPITRAALVRELDYLRDIELRDADGTLCNHLLYQLRQEEKESWLFVCHGLNSRTSWSDYITPYLNQPGLKENIVLRIRGAYSLEKYDTMTGEVSAYPSSYKDGWTTARLQFYAQDSCLFRLAPYSGTDTLPVPAPVYQPVELGLKDQVSYTRSEPNVLMLDMAEYRLDGGDWQKREEILRIDQILRDQLGYAQRTSSMAAAVCRHTPDIRDHMLELLLPGLFPDRRFRCMSCLGTAGLCHRFVGWKPSGQNNTGILR